MGTHRTAHAIDACIQIVSSLPQKSRFDIVKFGSGQDRLFKNGFGSDVYSDSTKKLAIDYCKNMNSQMGGTDVYSALKYGLEKS